MSEHLDDVFISGHVLARYDLQRRFGFGAVSVAGVNFLSFGGVVWVDYKPRGHRKFPLCRAV